MLEGCRVATGADVLGVTEAQDEQEDGRKEQQAEAEAHAATEHPGQLENQADADEDVQERHAQPQNPPPERPVICSSTTVL